MGHVRLRLALLCLSLAWSVAAPARAQTVSQKGFFDLKGVVYPQATVVDSDRVVGEALLRWEGSAKPLSWLKLVGAADARTDTHEQTTWEGLDWSDRTVTRPSLSVRRLDATISRGSLTFSAGKQFVRWGRTDTINPTDRFAPRDFLTVFDNDYLAVTAARLTAGNDTDTFDAVLARFTPSRIPLLDQRWSGASNSAPAFPIVDLGISAPNRLQSGIRWNHIGPGYEFSVSEFTGNSHLPLVSALPGPPRVPGTLPVVLVTREYPGIWMIGGDVAWPLTWFTAKAEAAFLGSSDGLSDEYLSYVIQAERQFGEWLAVLGYAGEAVTARHAQSGFAFDRGLTKAFLARASCTIDANRSMALDGAVRQDGSGSWLRLEYSQASGQHVRVTARASWIRGSQTTFFGLFNRNSNASVALRYSF